MFDINILGCFKAEKNIIIRYYFLIMDYHSRLKTPPSGFFDRTWKIVKFRKNNLKFSPILNEVILTYYTSDYHNLFPFRLKHNHLQFFWQNIWKTKKAITSKTDY